MNHRNARENTKLKKQQLFFFITVSVIIKTVFFFFNEKLQQELISHSLKATRISYLFAVHAQQKETQAEQKNTEQLNCVLKEKKKKNNTKFKSHLLNQWSQYLHTDC